jgi:hypothetical protein
MVISRRVVCNLPCRLRPEGLHQLVRRTELAGSLSPCTSGCHKQYTQRIRIRLIMETDHILSSALEESNFGIVCLAARNLESRWLNFETGAFEQGWDSGSGSAIAIRSHQ